MKPVCNRCQKYVEGGMVEAPFIFIIDKCYEIHFIKDDYHLCKDCHQVYKERMEKSRTVFASDLKRILEGF